MIHEIPNDTLSIDPDDHFSILSRDCRVADAAFHGLITDSVAKLYLNRLVACWNACRGIPTDALNAGLVKGMLEFAQKCHENADDSAADLIGDAYELLEPHGLLKSDAEADDDTRSNGPNQ